MVDCTVHDPIDPDGLLPALAVRNWHLHPIDKTPQANARVIGTTSQLVTRVELLNLTFDNRLPSARISNVEFAPLVSRELGLHVPAAFP